eukprot:7721032-Pyramimonas_sp.AAC.1
MLQEGSASRRPRGSRVSGKPRGIFLFLFLFLARLTPPSPALRAPAPVAAPPRVFARLLLLRPRAGHGAEAAASSDRKPAIHHPHKQPASQQPQAAASYERSEQASAISHKPQPAASSERMPASREQRT